MRVDRRGFLNLAAGVAVMSTGSRFARAQSYPSRPITMIVPFPPLAARLTQLAASWPRPCGRDLASR